MKKISQFLPFDFENIKQEFLIPNNDVYVLLIYLESFRFEIERVIGIDYCYNLEISHFGAPFSPNGKYTGKKWLPGKHLYIAGYRSERHY